MFFFFNDTATSEIYTLSLHDALPIWMRAGEHQGQPAVRDRRVRRRGAQPLRQELHLRGCRQVQLLAERSEEHTSELQSPDHLVCRLLLEKKKKKVKRS